MSQSNSLTHAPESDSDRGWEELSVAQAPLYSLLPKDKLMYAYTLTEREGDYLELDLKGLPRKYIAKSMDVTTDTVSNAISVARKKLELSLSEYKDLKATIQERSLDSPAIYIARIAALVFEDTTDSLEEICELDGEKLAEHLRSIVALLPKREKDVLNLYLQNVSQGQIGRTLKLHRSDPPKLFERGKRRVKELVEDASSFTSPITRLKPLDWMQISNRKHREIFQRYMQGWTFKDFRRNKDHSLPRSTLRDIVSGCARQLGLSKNYVRKKHLFQQVRRTESKAVIHRIYLRKIIGTDLMNHGYKKNVREVTQALEEVRRKKMFEQASLFALRLRLGGLSYVQIEKTMGYDRNESREWVEKIVEQLRAEIVKQRKIEFT